MKLGKRCVIFFGLVAIALLGALSLQGSEAFGSEKTYNWRLQAYDAGPTPGFMALEQFANEVGEKTRGRVNIKVFRAGTFGYSGFELHRTVGKGLIELAEPLDMSLMLEDPVTGINLLPFLFANNNDVLKGWPVAKKYVYAYLEKINCKPLMAYERPINYLYTKKKALIHFTKR